MPVKKQSDRNKTAATNTIERVRLNYSEKLIQDEKNKGHMLLLLCRDC